VRNRDVLVPMLRGIVKQRARDEWLRRLDEAGVPCGAIRTVGEVCEGEALKARAMVAEMRHASAGVVKSIKNPMHLSATPLDAYAPPPSLGQHTREILTGLLGYAARDVDDLARDGVI
jgi:formyl-CoA transferase